MDQPQFYMTVTSTDGTVTKGTCTEAEAARSLATAARRGYFAEVMPDGGTAIMRKVHGTAGGEHWVRLEPARHAPRLTATVRHDLFLIAVRPTAVYEPETGRIKAGYINSIPPAASALLRHRGLVTVSGTTVTVSLSARLAMLAQDNRPSPWSYEPSAAELSGLSAAILTAVRATTP
jgi:hypothetical protein